MQEAMASTALFRRPVLVTPVSPAGSAPARKRVMEAITRRAGDRAVVLLDRALPSGGPEAGALVDLVVAPSGLWVLDARAYDGLVEQRARGGWARGDFRLYLDGYEQSVLVEDLALRRDAAAAAVGAHRAPVTGALCFVGAEWPLFAKPWRQGNVWVTWMTPLVKMVAGPGPVSPERVAALAELAEAALPPAAVAA